MKSLLIRFFLSFWLIIGITVGVAAIGGYWYAQNVRDAYENFELGDSILDASAALDSAGRDGLKTWLQNYPETLGLRVLVLDRSGRDLLGRPVPRMLRRLLDRRRRFMPSPNHQHDDPANLLRARPLSQLVGPDGQRYTIVVIPTRGGPPARGLILALALLVSATVSLLLARTMSRPVQKLRDATRALADGNFDNRVASSIGRRKDELGLLARDFDVMADNLQRSAAQQVELSRNVSHELRSPLARLRVALELARRQAGNLAEFDRIDVETERLDALIAQILSYTRLDALAEHPKKMASLNEIIADVVADVNYECKSDGVDKKSVVSEFSASIDLPMHAQSMKSAIENILRNAIRHTRPDTRVLLKLAYENADLVSIIVDDFGEGVDAEDLEKLFEPFFRSRNSAEKETGSGLGLAIAKRAVEIHDGSISASNRAGGGLRITIELPA
jgi:two-component system sensor histidine kinase CpxA